MAGVVVWGVSGYLSKVHDGVTDRGDPLLTAWMLAWDQHQIVRDPLHLFDANVFHPFRDTLAFSENILGPALLAAPARLFTSNPIAVQNVSLASGFVLLGLGSFLLFRWICGDEIAAGAGAVAVALSPVRYTQLGHVQVLHTGALVLLLYGLLAFSEGRRRSPGPAVAAGLIFLTLSSLYLGVMAGVVAVVGMVFCALWIGARRTPEVLRHFLPWLALAAVVVLPILAPYRRLEKQLGYGGSLEDQYLNWASHKDYVKPLLGSLGSRIVGSALSLPRGRSAYLGLILCLLAVGAVLALRKRGVAAPSHRERAATWLFATLAVVFFALSLGAWRTFGDRRLLLPFYFVHGLPGFSGIRATSRFAIVVDLAVAGLAAFGLGRLRRRIAPRLGGAASGVLACGIGLFAFLERAPVMPIGPFESVETPAEAPHVYRWLAGDAGARGVLELPMTVGLGYREPWDVVPYKQVYFSTIHWKPLVNGWSGYLPPGYWTLTQKMWFFPREDVVRTLPYLPINRVVVHRRLYKIPIPASTFARGPFRILHECPQDLVVEVNGEPTPKAPRPILHALSSPSPDGSLHVQVGWDGAQPPLLYPPAEFRIAVRSRGEDARERTAEVSGWVMEPRNPKAFRISPGRSARSVTVEVTTGAGQRATASWNLAGR